MASPSVGAPALNYGNVNIETTSPGEVIGLIRNCCIEEEKLDKQNENINFEKRFFLIYIRQVILCLIKIIIEMIKWLKIK